MKAEIKEKWLEALRSGVYRQIKGRLGSSEGFCCLGVLCDVAGGGRWVLDGRSHLRRSESQDGEVRYIYQLKEGTELSMGLSEELMETLGIDQPTCQFLVALNDREKRPFIAIANWIEENIAAE